MAKAVFGVFYIQAQIYMFLCAGQGNTAWNFAKSVTASCPWRKLLLGFGVEYWNLENSPMRMRSKS